MAPAIAFYPNSTCYSHGTSVFASTGRLESSNYSIQPILGPNHVFSFHSSHANAPYATSEYTLLLHNIRLVGSIQFVATSDLLLQHREATPNERRRNESRSASE